MHKAPAQPFLLCLDVKLTHFCDVQVMAGTYIHLTGRNPPTQSRVNYREGGGLHSGKITKPILRHFPHFWG